MITSRNDADADVADVAHPQTVVGVESHHHYVNGSHALVYHHVLTAISRLTQA